MKESFLSVKKKNSRYKVLERDQAKVVGSKGRNNLFSVPGPSYIPESDLVQGNPGINDYIRHFIG